MHTLGYSNGSLKDVDEKSINSGGQCKEGLKMIVVIGDVPLSAYSPRSRGLQNTSDSDSCVKTML